MSQAHCRVTNYFCLSAYSVQHAALMVVPRLVYSTNLLQFVIGLSMRKNRRIIILRLNIDWEEETDIILFNIQC